MTDFGFDVSMQETYSELDTNESVSLNDRFIVPPFSVLDTRQGYWQDRKKRWNSIGLKSEKGRKENLCNTPELQKDKYSNGMTYMAPATSIFDPVLCEVCYTWFCPEGGMVLDPFAGGSVRGVVASLTGHGYTGIDLRQEQVDENMSQAKEIGCSPTWICDDSKNVMDHVEPMSADMIFSCPPYADLEVYSDDPRDISNMDYDDFLETYREIIKKTCACLKDNSFAVFVVGDVRDKKGAYRRFVSDTQQAFVDSGLVLYNDMILLEQCGTAAIRAPRMMNSSRKVVKTHQNVLVFYKGDVGSIKDRFGEVISEDMQIIEGCEADEA